jgi:ABC-type transport system substrate-binding protein
MTPFERNPFFSQPDRQFLDAIEVMEGGDSAQWLMMFERGELDIADVSDVPGIPIPDINRIQRSPRWKRADRKHTDRRHIFPDIEHGDGAVRPAPSAAGDELCN